jgi:DNA replication and repair protein RecF
VRQIIRLVAEHQFGQIFITDTNRDRMKEVLNELAIDYKLFLVESGSVKEQS